MADDDFRTGRNEDGGKEAGNWQSVDGDGLDLQLDAALAKYAAVEPRAGLEERVLASLRTERRRSPAHGWWHWVALAGVAGVLLVALTLWRSGELRREKVARRPENPTQDSVSNGTEAATNGGPEQKIQASHQAVVTKRAAHSRRQAPSVVASGPKLDHFPSPRPLSEQEKILQDYVARYPGHAALIAQARAEALRQDLAEEMKDASATKDSQQ
jgi:hypothetical protein